MLCMWWIVLIREWRAMFIEAEQQIHAFIITAEYHHLTVDGSCHTVHAGRSQCCKISTDVRSVGCEWVLEPTLKYALVPMRANPRRVKLDSQSQTASWQPKTKRSARLFYDRDWTLLAGPAADLWNDKNNYYYYKRVVWFTTLWFTVLKK